MAVVRYTRDCLEASSVDRASETGRDSRRPRRIRVFENGFIETVFGQTHPVTPLLWFGAPIVYGIHAGLTGVPGAAGTLGALLAGWLAWTLLEYLLHRFLFRFETSSPAQRLQSFMMHGYHRLYPDDGMRPVAPRLMGWPVALLLGLVWRLALGPAWWWPALAGTMIGYLACDWMHYYTHHVRPRTVSGR